MICSDDQDAIFAGVRTLLADFAAIHPTDDIVVVYSLDSREPAAWLAAGIRARGLSPKLVAMRPLVDSEFADRLRTVLPRVDDLRRRLVIFTLELDTMSHFDVLQGVLEEFGDRCNIVRIISASKEFFTDGMNLTPVQLTDRNATLLELLDGRQSVEVRAPGGTELHVELDSEAFDWISNRGVLRAGGFTILPPGEIATYPARISGVLVADGAVNCNVISRLDMRLADHPLTVEIEDGSASSFSCSDHHISELVGLCFARPFGRRVGELGFGTNSGISSFLPHNSHLNERRPGVHVGFGQHNQRLDRVDYLEDIHLDLIADGARIAVSGVPGVLDLKDLVVSCAAHPDVRDEDITGDCCGFGYGQLRTEGARAASPSRAYST